MHFKQIHSHFTRFSAAGNYYVKQSRVIISSFPSNVIPIELSELRETPFKQELSKVSLQILQNEETNIDMHYIGISKYLSVYIGISEYLSARWPHSLCARHRSERSAFEHWPGTLCCVLGQDTLLSRCPSPPRCINGYRQT